MNYDKPYGLVRSFDPPEMIGFLGNNTEIPEIISINCSVKLGENCKMLTIRQPAVTSQSGTTSYISGDSQMRTGLRLVSFQQRR
jgi:hypothetical protein